MPLSRWEFRFDTPVTGGIINGVHSICINKAGDQYAAKLTGGFLANDLDICHEDVPFKPETMLRSKNANVGGTAEDNERLTREIWRVGDRVHTVMRSIEVWKSATGHKN